MELAPHTSQPDNDEFAARIIELTKNGTIVWLQRIRPGLMGHAAAVYRGSQLTLYHAGSYISASTPSGDVQINLEIEQTRFLMDQVRIDHDASAAHLAGILEVDTQILT